MFKAGDWLRHKTIENEIVKAKNTGHRQNFVEVIDLSQLHWEVTRQYDINSLEPWQPKQGEWCWFWNEYDDIPTLNRFLCMYSDDENGLPNGFDFCEPFTGQLPSFLKDDK